MPLLSGPKLDGLVEELRTWYLDERERLIQALEEGGYPYGSVPKSPQEQVQQFFSMTQEDWLDMVAKLAERHRGHPDAQEMVKAELQDYVQKMTRTASRGGV